jgi:uncharacterized protein (TIGR02646 family)
VRRRSVPRCPDVLLPEGSKGAEERQQAIAHFTSPDWEQRRFTFSAYNCKEVRDALYEAFEGVCAYCEAPIPSIEIEHFRPKGKIRTEAGSRPPGYYWLAATWENLLPSCHDCNTELWKTYPDGTQRKAGKGTWFPLEVESDRATKPGDEKRERPLLLHPYRDEPAEHLEFVEEGILRARKDRTGVPSRRGEVTIELLGLNRRGLAEYRWQRLVLIESTHRKTIEAETLLREDPEDEARTAEHRRCVAELERLLARSSGFSALAAQYLKLGSN